MSIARKVKRSHQDHAEKYQRREKRAKFSFLRHTTGASLADFGGVCNNGKKYARHCHREFNISGFDIPF